MVLGHLIIYSIINCLFVDKTLHQRLIQEKIESRFASAQKIDEDSIVGEWIHHNLGLNFFSVLRMVPPTHPSQGEYPWSYIMKKAGMGKTLIY